ncbi:MAG: hypothetical protein AB7O28_26085 [Vicinamibacterales bacterium]
MARQEIRSYDYVNRPYAQVRAALVGDPTGIFRDATRAVTDRVRAVAGALKVTVAGLEVGADVLFMVGGISDDAESPLGGPMTRIPVSWEGAEHPGWFPLMDGVLSVYPLTATETQLDFLGRYDPPMGVVGDAVNALVGHRIAEASVHRFIGDVARYLRESAA